MKIRTVGAELFRQTDRQTKHEETNCCFHSFANAPKKLPHGVHRETTNAHSYNDDGVDDNNNNNNNNIRPDPATKFSGNLYDIYICCVYCETLLLMDRGTVQIM